MNTLTLKTTNAEFHELHRIVDASRANSVEIKVPKAAVWNLLRDHAALLPLLRGQYIEPKGAANDTTVSG